LAVLGGLTAVVPEAVVQHGFAASVRRRADRVPLNLHDIGASATYFLRRHAPGIDMDLQHRAHRGAQNARLLQHMVQGGLEPRGIGPLLASFDQGWADGLLRDLSPLPSMPDTAQEFQPLGTMPRAGLLISGRIWQRRELMRRAGVEAALGKIVTVICLSPTTWYHHHNFESGGFWVQRGGVYGKSVRDQALIRRAGFVGRAGDEAARIAKTRPIS
jgi:O-antigen biosynthesis protein